uniref:Uncharacterized protein n=1 Tax=mine drainage metagenome TaxID=410659 RepID=E6QUK4_9ZZZZ
MSKAENPLFGQKVFFQRSWRPLGEISEFCPNFQIDTTIHRSKSHASHGLQRFASLINRTLLLWGLNSTRAETGFDSVGQASACRRGKKHGGLSG